MIKNLSKLLLPCVFGLAACSQSADEPASPDTGASTGSSTVTMTLSRAAADDFLAAGISRITILTYQVDREGSPLIDEKDVEVGSGRFEFEFPLGETYQAFAVANAGAINDKEFFETVSLKIDPSAKNDVWVSTPVKFASDKSVSSVSLVMRRVVAEVNFTPAEEDSELAAQSYFDRLDLTFKNVASTYMVATTKAVADEFSFTVTAANGYKTSFHTFATTSLETKSSLFITYYNGGSQVNVSPSDLDTGVTFDASRRYNLIVPVTNPDFIAIPWTSSTNVTSRSGMPGITVEEYDF